MTVKIYLVNTDIVIIMAAIIANILEARKSSEYFTYINWFNPHNCVA